MDSIVGLPLTRRQNDSIWQVVDRLTKSTHFISVKSTYSVKDYAKIYIYVIESVHGIPLSIILNRVAQFKSRFWRSFQKGLGTQVKLSNPFHPQTDG